MERFDPDDMFRLMAAREKQLLQRETDRLVKLEAAAVKQILKRANLLVLDGEEATNLPNFTFQWFHETYPGFPLRLLARNVSQRDMNAIRELLDRKFHDSPFVRQFSDALAGDDFGAATRRVAIVFRWNQRLMTFHNYPRRGEKNAPPVPAVQVPSTFLADRFHGTHIVCVREPLTCLIDAIGSDWAHSV